MNLPLDGPDIWFFAFLTNKAICRFAEILPVNIVHNKVSKSNGLSVKWKNSFDWHCPYTSIDLDGTSWPGDSKHKHLQPAGSVWSWNRSNAKCLLTIEQAVRPVGDAWRASVSLIYHRSLADLVRTFKIQFYLFEQKLLVCQGKLCFTLFLF